jgi:hypothetical protein
MSGHLHQEDKLIVGLLKEIISKQRTFAKDNAVRGKDALVQLRNRIVPVEVCKMNKIQNFLFSQFPAEIVAHIADFNVSWKNVFSKSVLTDVVRSAKTHFHKIYMKNLSGHSNYYTFDEVIYNDRVMMELESQENKLGNKFLRELRDNIARFEIFVEYSRLDRYGFNNADTYHLDILGKIAPEWFDGNPFY